jgi:hypothetical protein
MQAEALRDDLDPIAKEIEEHRAECADMQSDVEDKSWIFPAEEPWNEG